MSLQQFLEEQNKNLAKLYTEYSEASWKTATTGDPEWQKLTVDRGVAIKSYYSNKELFEKVKQYLQETEIDSLHKRQLQSLYSNLVENQLPEEVLRKMVETSTELSSTFNLFRATLDGNKVSENEIRQILINSNDLDERKKAWEASKQIGNEVAEKVISLVKIRNEAALKLGFKNHHEMAFKLKELDRDEIFSMFQSLKDQSDESFAKVKGELDEELAERFGITVSELRPWHYADPFFQEAPPAKDLNLDQYYEGKDIEQITVDTFTAMGLDITDLLEKSDLYPRDKKNQHAFMSNINRDGDIRVLCNINQSDYWMATMLHEFGHAVYDKYVDQNLPFMLRGYSHILSTEAIAMFYGRMSKNPNWLEQFAGVPKNEAEEITPKLKKALQRQMLIAGRWIITFVFFERELYENPDQDLNALWWKIVKEVQFVNPPEGRDEPDWAAKIHFTIAPVYYQNYLLGELTASQLHHYIEKNVTEDFFTHDVGTFLKDQYFIHGGRYHWNEKIEKVTGEKLNPRYFVEQFM
ncbi:peptidase M3A and M3B thimet/oligopeptidase F [Anaerobacillus arseniciselenatis]|uniref:Peptidase M3A and M3B thimet/oligopeptidase F n=1 Tax=Anaerobacillus arseniciselenatis TaxID=85682 RepID=A0A1S2LT71_9BACI|nr:M2 family metallopeptidase [Anaerobacillus arseniciselenatis]OIJ15739.1 peptidase M3A and M3B thimet/oligopeptidase F [Anaerobacillus arseniciselenatis]